MRSVARSLATAAAIAGAASLTLDAGSANASPILLESAAPHTGVRLDGSYIPGTLGTVDYTGIELLVSGGYKFLPFLGVEVAMPFGFYIPDAGPSKTVQGNADIAARLGFGFNLGAVRLQAGGALHLFVPTSSGNIESQVANGALAIATINHPGFRAFKDFTVQPALAARVGIAIVDVYASLAPSFAIPTDNGDTITSLQGGIGVGITPLPFLTVQAEFLGSHPFVDGGNPAYQVGIGVVARPPVVELSLNARIPVDEISRTIAPAIVGFGVGASF